MSERIWYVVWSERLTGVFGAIGLIYGFLEGISDSLFSAVVSALGTGLGFALITYIVLYVVIIVVGVSWGIASEETSPIRQGIKFVMMLVILATVYDFLLLGGMVMFRPLLHLVLEGDLSGTYWDCLDYVIAEEGQYCADDNLQ